MTLLHEPPLSADSGADASARDDVYVLPFSAVRLGDIPEVGGKNASLGELIANLQDAGVRVPNGFATTASAFNRHLRETGIDSWIRGEIVGLDVDDVARLAIVGARIRARIEAAPLAPELEAAIRKAFAALEAETDGELLVAVRSSATAEDLPDASFAGQQETFLNIAGIDNVLAATRKVFASLFTDRAIAYRVHQGYAHTGVAISVGVQRMVRSDEGAAGVMFSIDTESGYDGAVFVTSAYGLGEGVVQGAVNPDEFTVHKRTLREGLPAVLSRRVGSKATRMVFTEDTRVGRTTEFVETPVDAQRRFSVTDAEVTELAQAALAIEEHYGRPMDIEWGKDGIDGRIYILQARPETVVSQRAAGTLERHSLLERGATLVEGRAIGQRIGAGVVRLLTSPSQMSEFQQGDVLVADMTDPDWEPIMKRASAIVTNRGGRTCHAAIIARELGVPAVVGAGDATERLADGDEVTVTCADGETGAVLEGILPIEVERIELDSFPELPGKIMLNVGNPDAAFTLAALPNDGVGLARMEFVISGQIGVHPRALLELGDQEESIRAAIDERIAAYDSPADFFVRRLAEGVSTLAAAFDGKPVIVRLSDFKSNEYAGLLGGSRYEPVEENPMLGFRGASRYISDEFAEAFALECEAIRLVRDDMGLTNVKVMIPFVRTVEEARAVVERLAENGLRRGQNGLEVIMMCEVPSNALLAEQFLEVVDGFSIGSNDLTQLTLGIDRDSALIADSFDERNPAVLRLIDLAIEACTKHGRYVGICGQAPSDHPELAQYLFDRGISSLSLNPDTVVETWTRLAAKD
ncbi:phosphoenolpyruvate synthase [Pseudoclavibacter sp. RFBA6]|uniref:phosphoenolpyruvate synthase n=1 Tax=Pseudoclavibacter sp. RFBA6 TaxID=2080573 RepID=UPI000CE880D7|nr:phosphoenolpyruvate synthase [Pseudoclavibacter sp. RFBA6]PPG37981.1 phosphoenolpyruvate synthase [Pseudoclavibacter sp. RFBA6]